MHPLENKGCTLNTDGILYQMWPVTAKGTFRPILHITEMVQIPFRHNEAATSRQVVIEYYCTVSGQLIME